MMMKRPGRGARPHRCRPAFTLIEVVLATGLTIGIVLSALAFYQQIISARESFGQQLQAAQVTAARRLVMEKMTGELRSAVVYPFLKMGLTGDANSMQFVVAQVPGQDVWQTTNMTDEPPEPQQDLRIVGWRLRVVEDIDTGELVIEGIERTEQKVLTAEVVDEEEDVTAVLVGRGFGFLSLRYWDNQSGQWLTSWDGSDAPMAVEIVLGIEPLPENAEPEDYPYETFRRVVYVPAGRTKFGGSTIMRGAGGTGP